MTKFKVRKTESKKSLNSCSNNMIIKEPVLNFCRSIRHSELPMKTAIRRLSIIDVSPVNVIPTVNVIQINRKCNTNCKCNSNQP